MKVKELKHVLQFANDNDEVVVEVKGKEGYMHVATPSVTVKSAHSGFDWNSGMFFIKPSIPLGKEELE